MTPARAIALYREQQINALLRPYAEAIAQGFQQAVAELEADYLHDPEQVAFDTAREVEHRAVMERHSLAIEAAARLREGTRKDVAARERRERLDANEPVVRWQPLPMWIVWRAI